jgi:hypothetical protein
MFEPNPDDQPATVTYVDQIPEQLPQGEVLIHNRVAPGSSGFLAWTQALDSRLERCDCDWAGTDLHGLAHYRVASTPRE